MKPKTHIRHLVEEIRTSEQTYVDGLKEGIEIYRNRFKKDLDIPIKQKYIEIFFDKWDDIIETAETFIGLFARVIGLEDEEEMLKELYDIFFYNFQSFDIYIKYIGQSSYRTYIYSKMCKDEKQRLYLENIMKEGYDEGKTYQKLDAYMILPVQRMPRIQLFVIQIIRHIQQLIRGEMNLALVHKQLLQNNDSSNMFSLKSKQQQNEQQFGKSMPASLRHNASSIQLCRPNNGEMFDNKFGNQKANIIRNQSCLSDMTRKRMSICVSTRFQLGSMTGKAGNTSPRSQSLKETNENIMFKKHPQQKTQSRQTLDLSFEASPIVPETYVDQKQSMQQRKALNSSMKKDLKEQKEMKDEKEFKGTREKRSQSLLSTSLKPRKEKQEKKQSHEEKPKNVSFSTSKDSPIKGQRHSISNSSLNPTKETILQSYEQLYQNISSKINEYQEAIRREETNRENRQWEKKIHYKIHREFGLDKLIKFERVKWYLEDKVETAALVLINTIIFIENDNRKRITIPLEIVQITTNKKSQTLEITNGAETEIIVEVENLKEWKTMIKEKKEEAIVNSQKGGMIKSFLRSFSSFFN